jgi:alkylation response protein AidB-like acyl-CoA dehydrogenase
MSSAVAEQQEAILELRDLVRRFVTDRAPLTEARRLLDGGAYDADIWSIMADQLGLPGLTIAEEHGGAGAGWAEAAVVLEEMGRSLVPSAYFASVVLAGSAVSASKDSPLACEILPMLASGRRTAALAVLEDDGRGELGDVALAAARDDEGYRLDGHKSFVLDGHLADILVVAARTDLGLSLFVVDGDSPGLTRTALPTLDPTRPQSRLEFQAVPGRLLGAEGQAEPVLKHTFDRALLAVAADALGGADRCLEMSLAYAKERVAFGRPIGGFQAVKHKLADLYLEIEFARSAVEHAAQAADSDPEQFPVLASLALAHCVDTYALVATETIHLHGGIGFTWEHDAQLFFRRAKSSQVLFGDSAYHRERIAARLLDDETQTRD